MFVFSRRECEGIGLEPYEKRFSCRLEIDGIPNQWLDLVTDFFCQVAQEAPESEPVNGLKTKMPERVPQSFCVRGLRFANRHSR